MQCSASRTTILIRNNTFETSHLDTTFVCRKDVWLSVHSPQTIFVCCQSTERHLNILTSPGNTFLSGGNLTCHSQSFSHSETFRKTQLFMCGCFVLSKVCQQRNSISQTRRLRLKSVWSIETLVLFIDRFFFGDDPC